MPFEKIKKRDGKVVDFDRTRIESAIRNACIATKTSIEEETVGLITDNVVHVLGEVFIHEVPSVENIQDVVEGKIAEAGLFEVAKAYILYRKEHEQKREKEKAKLLEKVEKSELTVRKRDGRVVDFDVREIEEKVKYCCAGYESQISVKEVVDGCKENMYDGISTSEINKAVVMSLRAKIEKDPLFSFLTARFLINDTYKEVLGVDGFENHFGEAHRIGFPAIIRKGVKAGRYDKRLLDFDLAKMANALKQERDALLTYLGIQTLYDRYLVKDLEQRILETPQYCWMRIAMGLALEEPDKEEKAIEFYEVISLLRYLPSTPTLFHSGTSRPQMSSCFLSTVEDDLGHIFKCIGDNAQLAKWSGGLGNDWTNIRGTGSLIKSTNVGSQGVIPFLKIVDSATAAINRSGKRRGATCVYLETWHYDIEAFLELRKNTGDDRRRTHDTNTANWIPDLFMKRVLANQGWTLFSPDETPELHHIYGKEFEKRYEEYELKAERGELQLFRKVQAQDLWRKMITMLFETGHPWVTFKDPSNIRSPQDHVGVVHSSNLCTEITLNTSPEETAVCNLGSVNLVRHIQDGAFDRDLLARTIRTAIRMLDNVISLNFYPTKETERANRRHRPIGMGIMGFQDALCRIGLRFDSEEALALSDELMEFVSYHATFESSILAKERGAYSSYKGSKWDRGLFPIDTLKILGEERGMPIEVNLSGKMDWKPVREHVKLHGMRNSNCLAIAPTATIANIAGCLPSIEPIYKNIYVKSNVSGEFTVINSYLVDELKGLGLWDEEMLEKLKYYDGSVQHISEIPADVRTRYKEVFEIGPHWIVRHAANRGKWIDQSQSVNIFTTSNSGKFLSDVYFTAWKMGLKTTYYLRTLGASAIEKSTIDIAKKYEEVQLPERAKQTESVITAEKQEHVAQRTIHIADDGICEACE